MRQTIDRGMEELQAEQGNGGLPAAVPSATAPSTTAALAQSQPPSDPNDGGLINQQLKDADHAEQDVAAQARQ